jgi:SPP1 gp7 family putative phage head morphogenesis protein
MAARSTTTPRYPDHLARRYRALLLRRQAQVYRLLKAQIDVALARRAEAINARARTDAEEDDDIAALLRLISVVEGVVRDEMRPDAATLGVMARQLELFARREVDEPIKRLARVKFLPDTLGGDQLIRGWIRENVDLITSIDERLFDDVRTKVEEALRSGRSTRDLTEDIQNRYQVSRARAELIARDQVSKANGQISRQRQADLGITEYTWRTSRDERVRGKPGGLYPNARPSHHALQGKRFPLRGPGAPGVGHPGDDYQCRCTQEPVLPGDTVEKLQAYDQRAAAAEQRRAAFSTIGKPAAA